jgi:hypothetical protein
MMRCGEAESQDLGPLSDAMEMQGRREKWNVLLCVTVLPTDARDVGFDASVLEECRITAN